jgi:hypothetical protein
VHTAAHEPPRTYKRAVAGSNPAAPTPLTSSDRFCDVIDLGP